MTRNNLITCALTAGIALGAAHANADPKPASDHVTIRIDEQNLHPAVARVKKGGAVAWLNYARWKAQVRFPEATASKLSCPDGTHWYKNEDGKVASMPIQNLEYHLPCTLPTGTYEYEVGQASSYIGQPGSGESTALLKGKIIVE